MKLILQNLTLIHYYLKDRNLRKKGLTNILNGLFSKENDTKLIIYIFQVSLAKNLLKVIDDKIEKNREMVYNIL